MIIPPLPGNTVTLYDNDDAKEFLQAIVFEGEVEARRDGYWGGSPRVVTDLGYVILLDTEFDVFGRPAEGYVLRQTNMGFSVWRMTPVATIDSDPEKTRQWIEEARQKAQEEDVI